MSHSKKQGHSFTATRLLIGLTTVLFIGACNSGNEADKKNADATTVAAASFKLNCVILEKKQIQTWVDKGWTDPKKPDSLITKILLQFYSADAADAAANMQLAIFPSKTYTKVYAAGRQDAAIDPTCTALMPVGKAILGNNFLNLKNLNILDASGQLTDFTFIRLRPVQNKAYGDYITFKWEVVRTTGAEAETILNSGETSDPCPTFCEDEGEGLQGQ